MDQALPFKQRERVNGGGGTGGGFAARDMQLQLQGCRDTETKRCCLFDKQHLSLSAGCELCQRNKLLAGPQERNQDVHRRDGRCPALKPKRLLACLAGRRRH